MTTIGVAVAVPHPCGAQLQEYRVALGDPAAAGIPTHITLLPPVDVEDDLLPRIGEHLREVASGVEAFPVHLRGTGTFRPVSPVVFVNLAQGISSCEQLAAGVRRGPLAVDAQYPYHPHVTVAHGLDEHLLDRAYDELAGFECRFQVARVTLYVHRDGDGWTPHGQFPLHEVS
ncbi:MAG: 2H phosphoesterase superfamily protein Bsu1186 (yjcG) [uncultured Nocardioidaceae bacterium]|uniref:2H phosphoesterase superfamily protein Bsu1186 (YjcG) n=1 Tax=uncultured Nocardioidaceae bacterium TaxID=253824 RepID=A0A6J4M502_9ACTN|nr:MAG: 2H phosphoesterase superfamily protein Bsu1186 (yjcG) [uncultured Nocardioidaceae bacterium]